MLPGKQAEWDAWVAREMETIAAQGRLFPGRDHVHTAVYACVRQDADAVLALERGYAGVVAAADVDGAPELSPPAAVRLRLDRTIISQADPPPHELVLGFCAGDPLEAFRAQPALATCGFASPFLATVPATDTYTGDL